MAAESIKEISFTIARHDEHAVRYNKLTSTVNFKLTLGPCGRYVEDLESTIDYHGVTVKQVPHTEDVAALWTEWLRINTSNVLSMRAITGIYPGEAQRTACGYGNVQEMTPTKEQHEANILYASNLLAKIEALRKVAEIKEFFDKLEDVRGGIVVIR